MIIEHIKSTTVITQEKLTLEKFVSRLNEVYQELSKNNIVINLFSLTSLKASDLKEFSLLSEKHKADNHSFVLVTDAVPYEDIPEALTVAPTLQEAHDLIEMEEIERDLGI
ncbi:hypothetical protein [Aquimarina agarivorans]|uniref:hypothetical protein n=1 Tax=Aquimarina agarivorans TaxID=980584 RepID=UPI000248F2F7|nr:hypothetical protein [Aquimarina agarivorans]